MVRMMQASIDLILNAGTLLPDVDRMQAAVDAKMQAWSRKASAPLAQRMRAEMDLLTKATQEQQQSDMAKQRASVATKQRIAEEDAARAQDIASMKRHAQERALYNHLMAQPLMPPRMDGAMGRGGVAGGGRNGAMLSRMQQGSYAIQDLIQVMGNGGSLAQGMNAVANNLGAMATMAGTFQGAIAGVALTVTAMAAAPAWDAIRKMITKATEASEAFKHSIEGIQQRIQVFDRAAGTRGALARNAAEMAGDLGEVRRRKADEEGGEHGLRDFRRGLENRKIQMNAEDAEAKQNLADEQAKAAQITKELDADRKFREDKDARKLMRQAVGFLGFGDMPGEKIAGVGREMSDEQTAEYKEQLKESLKRQADAQEKINKNVHERAQIEGVMSRTARDASAEESKDRAKKKEAFDKRFDHMQEETGNEFTNRLNRNERDYHEQRAEIEKAKKIGIITEDEAEGRMGQAFHRRVAANTDVRSDELLSKTRFMRGMEAHQKGTGSVHAVEDKLSEDLQRAEKLFANDPRGLAAARGQAFATAQAENQRIINANRPKGGQYFGIEEYSKHLMSQIAGGNPDEKQIADNTLKAAENLDQILQKMKQGFVIGAN